MPHTLTQNGSPLITLLALPLLAAVMVVMFSNRADAGEASAPELAVVPTHAMGQLHVSAVCDGDVAAFKLTNSAQRWSERGVLRVLDGSTGHVLRERSLLLGERQSATFRIRGAEVPSSRFRVTVVMPGGQIAYAKSFAGRCEDTGAGKPTAQR